jgi:glutamyl-Q tRNA(Asp) synthetase
VPDGNKVLTMNEKFITRFAPSPTGHLHLGHAFSALLAFDMARKKGGPFILRIEDIDHTRCRPEFEQAIYDDLHWLGITWGEPVMRQSTQMPFYRQGLEKLQSRGLLYRCFKTRKEIAALCEGAKSGPDGPVYIGTPLPAKEEAAKLAAEETFAWRLSSRALLERYERDLSALSFLETNIGPAGEKGGIPVDPSLFGDVVLARKDTGIAYHLACTLDDAAQDITHVIRGQDLFYASHIHRVLQMLLELPAPQYHHHHLITDAQGRKFSKRDQSKTLQSLRAEGVTPRQIREMVGL